MFGNQPAQFDDVLARLDQTKPVVERDPFIGSGQHDSLIVMAIEMYNDQKWGKSVRASFEVEKSTLHPAGSRVVKIWNLFKPSKFPSQATDADQFAQFVCVLQGLPEGQHAAACRTILKSRAEGGNAEAQPARGARIRASGFEVGKVNERGQRYVRVQWATFAGQDGNMVAQTRAQLDAKSPYQEPAPQNYAQPDPRAQQYQAAGSPTAVAPQNPQAQQFVQQYQQAPQGYAPAPTQPTAPPAGGFLAMLPPNPNGGR